MIYKGAMGLMTALMVCAASSCSDEDTISNLPAAYVPSEISFNLPDEVRQLIYVDNTGASVLPMIKGETMQLEYTLSPDTATFQEVVWSSSEESVATVDNGLVTALSGAGVGYSIVQVAPKGVYSGSGIFANLKIKVVDEMVHATGIEISASATEVYGGETIQLSATISPADATYQTVRWSSSNETAATVDINGLVTAHVTDAVTTPVTITATALDGSGATATCDITVMQIVQPQEVTISQDYSVDNGYYCAINEKTLDLNFATVPASSTLSQLQWTSSDESIATVSGGKVTFNQEGNFGDVTITATCPETGNSSSVKLNLAAGLIRELFHDQDNYTWYNAKQSGNGTSSSHVWHYGYITVSTYTQNATNQRADLKCWSAHTWMHAGNYPIFAVRMDDVKDQGISSRNINVDAVGTAESGTSYKAIANGNNKYLYDYKCSDGSHVFVYDLSTQACGTGGLMPTNETVDFTTLQIKYADMRTVDHQLNYNVYWIQTFRSLTELQEYITSEGLTYSE